MADKLLKFVDLIERRRALFDKIRSKPESLIRETIGEKDFSILEKLPPQLLGSIMQTAALQLTASTETADLTIRVVSLAAAAGFWKTLHVGLIGAAELSREANDMQRSGQHEIVLVFSDFAIGDCAGSETTAGVVEKALRHVGGVLSCDAYETVKAMLKAESLGFVGCALIDLFSIFVCSAISEELAAGRPLVGELMQKASIMLVNERHLSMRMQTHLRQDGSKRQNFYKKAWGEVHKRWPNGPPDASELRAGAKADMDEVKKVMIATEEANEKMQGATTGHTALENEISECYNE